MSDPNGTNYHLRTELDAAKEERKRLAFLWKTGVAVSTVVGTITLAISFYAFKAFVKGEAEAQSSILSRQIEKVKSDLSGDIKEASKEFLSVTLYRADQVQEKEMARLERQYYEARLSAVETSTKDSQIWSRESKSIAEKSTSEQAKIMERLNEISTKLNK